MSFGGWAGSYMTTAKAPETFRNTSPKRPRPSDFKYLLDSINIIITLGTPTAVFQYFQKNTKKTLRYIMAITGVLESNTTIIGPLKDKHHIVGI